MKDSNFFIVALENIKNSVKEERYTLVIEKLDYLIDSLKDQFKAKKEEQNGL